MSTLPLIFSVQNLDKKPKRQGGVFSLSPNNKVKMSKTEEMMQVGNKSFDGRSSKFSLYSLPKKGPGKISRYSKQVFAQTSSFVSPDTTLQFSKNPEEVDSVGTIKNRINISIQLIGIYLKNEKQTLSKLNEDLIGINEAVCQQLNTTEINFKQKFQKLRQTLSEMRKETGMETKTNRVQQVELTDGMKIMKQMFSQQNQKTLFLMKQCQMSEEEKQSGEGEKEHTTKENTS